MAGLVVILEKGEQDETKYVSMLTIRDGQMTIISVPNSSLRAM